MGRRTLRLMLLTLAFSIACGAARAQFYSQGADPYSTKWMQAGDRSVRIIYPREFHEPASRLLDYMRWTSARIGYGLTDSLLGVPVVVHTANFSANGLAMTAPRRIEMFAFPSVYSYSEPWLKQLATHEYRHMAQYSALRRSTVAGVSRVFGQQAQLLATALMPFWFIEGDAVDAETQLSTFGRALQPSFTMAYRAIGREILEGRSPQKWFCGSYIDYVPSHYELGYQMVSWANARFGRYIWGDVMDFTSRHPLALPTFRTALRRKFSCDVRDIFTGAFTELNDLWDSLERNSDSALRIGTVEGRGLTVYSHPVMLPNGRIVSFKKDSDHAPAIVETDPVSHAERILARTGSVNSGAAAVRDTLYWTELRRSVFWEQAIASQLCWLDLATGTTGSVPHHGDVVFPTDADGTLAMVRFGRDGLFRIVCGQRSLCVPSGTSVHGLAYDGRSGRLFAILLEDRGMGICYWEPETGRTGWIREPVHVTLSDLRSAGGRLFFGSVYSGIDEIHMIDLTTGQESRITSSRYGSFDPAPSTDGTRLALTVYDRSGYILALQDAVPDETYVQMDSLPRSIVNPQRLSWNIGNVDLLDSSASPAKPASQRRYGKNSHLLGVHSWGPVGYVIDDISDGDLSSIRLGASALSQNLLSSAESAAAVGYTYEGELQADLSVSYLALAPKFSAGVSWRDSAPELGTAMLTDGEGTVFTLSYRDGSVVGDIFSSLPELRSHSSSATIRFNGYLPMNFQHGSYATSLIPMLEYRWRNTPSYDPDSGLFRDGSGTLRASIQLSAASSSAPLDVMSPLSGGVKVTCSSGSSEASVISVLARMTLPGLASHHGLSLRANRQNVVGDGTFTTPINDLVPRGMSSTPSPVDYTALSADYQMPLAYPDWGVNGLLFLRRIRIGAYFDYATYGSFSLLRLTPDYVNMSRTDRTVISYGGSVWLDTVFFNMPKQSETSLKLSVYFLSTRRSPILAGGFVVPF